MVRSTVRASLECRFFPSLVSANPKLSQLDLTPREGRFQTSRKSLPKEWGNRSVDDHSQPDLRGRSGTDCSAAECIDHVQPASDLSTTESTPPVTLRPFVWQRGRRLLLLEREMGAWVLAELEFQPEICRYS